MERFHAGVDELPPDRLRVRVGDLTPTIVAPDSSDPRASVRPSLRARVNQFPNRSRNETPPSPARKCTVLGPIPASVRASATSCRDASDRRVPMTAFLGVAWNLIPGGRH